MMNRYITALLVVLAATGVEAQTYRSALKLALGDLSVEQIIDQPEAKALEEDLLTIIKALKQADLNGPHELKHITGTAFFRATEEALQPAVTKTCPAEEEASLLIADCKAFVFIRGPDDTRAVWALFERNA